MVGGLNCRLLETIPRRAHRYSFECRCGCDRPRGLLHDVRRFVSEKAHSLLGTRIILACAEKDVLASREGDGIHRAGQRVSLAVGVQSNITEVRAQALLKFGACVTIQAAATYRGGLYAPRQT